MSRKAKIGITKDFLDEKGKFIIPGPGLKLLDELPNTEYEILSEYLPEVTLAQVRGFDIIINLKPKWPEQSLIGNDQLLSIHRGGVGYEKIDVRALNNAGIMLFITPDGVRRPVATAIIALILALSMRLRIRDKLIREGRWVEARGYIGDGLIGKTLGSMGAGNIGHEMFLLAKPFGMNHIAYDPYLTEGALADVDVKLADLDIVLAESDFLSIGCPLNEDTFHIIGEDELAKMKKTAFLINTACGAIVDEGALIKTLREGRIQEAGIDVFEQEPV